MSEKPQKPKAVILKNETVAVIDPFRRTLKLYIDDDVPPTLYERNDLLQLRDLLNEAFPTDDLVAAAQALERAVDDRADMEAELKRLQGVEGAIRDFMAGPHAGPQSAEALVAWLESVSGYKAEAEDEG